MFAKFLGVLACSAIAITTAQATDKPPQYVLISFDGAGPLPQWERSLSLGAEANARFTYFLSCVYLLGPETRKHYTAPGSQGPRSNVGYASSREDIKARLEHIWKARAEGHEIASHGCGHLDGAKWSVAQWDHEFGQFRTILEDAWTINGISGEPADWGRFVREEISGFRAPYLSYSDNLFTALRQNGFVYDASTVSSGPARPANKDGLHRFSLPLIPEGPSARPVIAMDYNLFVRHSNGEETSDLHGEFEQRAYDAFLTAFSREYAGNRVPLQIGLHFTLMNDGAYWRALERFSREICTMADVRCVTYSQYLQEYLNT